MKTGLTYRKRIVKQPEYKTVELKVPDYWGMFTSQGNKSLYNKAVKLVENVKSTDSTIKRLKYFAQYFKSWRKLSRTKTMGEAGDTAVREHVWGFAEELGKCIGIDYDSLDNVWNSKDAR